MKHLLFIIPIFIFFAFHDAQASHVAGGDISYECIGEDSFAVTANFYRDCTGCCAGPTTTITLRIKCLETNQEYTQVLTANLLGEVSQLCASALSLSSCNGGTLVGMQWYQGTVIVDLGQYAPTNCTNWSFSYQVGNRNPSINTIGASSEYYYVESLLNNGQSRDCNNSPYFTAQPIPYVCAEQPVVYSFGVGEQDGDSLVYALDTAYIFGGPPNALAYQPGFSPQMPLPGITINQLTGELNFIAPALTGGQDNYVVVVKVREYDRATGEFVGAVTRDIQLVVIDCLGNVPPQSIAGGIQNFTGTGAQIDSNSVVVCYGQSFNFELGFEDLDTFGNLSNDSLFVTSNISTILPGATFTATAGNPVTVTVSWVAQPVNNGFATFNFFVQDNACPVFGINTYTYDIIIVPSTVLGPDTLICSQDTIELNAQGGNTFTWSVIPNPGGGMGDPIVVGTNFGCDSCKTPWINPSQTTTYVVESDLDAACGNTDTITISVFDQYPVGITTSSPYCVDELLDTLTAQTPGGTWLGPGIANSQAGIFVPGALDPGFGNDTIIQMVYVLQGTCGNTSSIDIVVKGYPDARILTKGPLCEQTVNQQLEGYTAGGSWSGQNVTNSGVIDPSSFTAPDTVRVFHTINDAGCVFTDSLDFRIISEYNSEIDSLPKICDGDEILIHLNDYEADPFGVWSGAKVTQDPPESGEYYYNTANLSPGSYSLTYEILGDCGTKSSKDLVVSPLPDASIFGADSVYCDNIEDSIVLETARDKGIWGGNMNELYDGYFIPSRIGEGLYTISYELYDTTTTCYNKEVVDVRIARTPVGPAVFGGGPYCQGYDLNNLRADGLLTNTFKWFQKPEGASDSILIGAGNPFRYGLLTDMPTVLYATQVSDYGCESPTSRLVIEVLPSPVADFESDTLYGNVPFDLAFINTSGPDSMNLFYNWSVNDMVESSEENFTYNFTDIGRYNVTLLADNGSCTNEKNVLVLADRLTDFFAPNVFTPNDDGFNDYFQWDIEGIENFEITIYNRWGGKVYETQDIEEFWDGGKEPSGVYYYIMSGSEATLDQESVDWRGDLTLIRD